MSDDIILFMLFIAASFAFCIGSSVSLGIVGYREGWFGSGSAYEGKNCQDMWMKECDGTRGKERETCINASRLQCILEGGVYTPPDDEKLGDAPFPLDCNAGARQACSGKGQKCVDDYKAQCIANGGQWTASDGTIQAICGRKGLKVLDTGLPCPTNSGCLLKPECRAACPCGHTYTSLDTDRENCVYLYLHNDGVNDHVEGPLKICAPASGQKTVDLSTYRNPNSSISYDEKVSSLRVGKNVGVKLYKKDGGLPLVFPSGGPGHAKLMNVGDYCGTPVATVCGENDTRSWNDAVHTVVIGKSMTR
jgi:hypothetical protein